MSEILVTGKNEANGQVDINLLDAVTIVKPSLTATPPDEFTFRSGEVIRGKRARLLNILSPTHTTRETAIHRDDLDAVYGKKVSGSDLESVRQVLEAHRGSIVTIDDPQIKRERGNPRSLLFLHLPEIHDEAEIEELRRHMLGMVEPMIGRVRLPITVVMAARQIAEVTPSQLFSNEDNVVNFSNLVFTRGCIRFNEVAGGIGSKFYIDRNGLVAFAALAKRYVDIADADPNLQREAARSKEPLELSFINRCIGLRNLVATTRDFLTVLGYTDEVAQLVTPKEKNRWVDSSKRREGYMPPERVDRGNSILTPHQGKILSLFAEGLTQEEIADWLKISPQTVASTSRTIRTRLNAQSTTEAVIKALLRKVIPFPSTQISPEAIMRLGHAHLRLLDALVSEEGVLSETELLSEKLGISPSTVKNELGEIYGVLGVANRSQAATYYLKSQNEITS